MSDQPAGRRRHVEVRARHTESTLTVYQAYNPDIGRAATRHGRFPSSWSRERMTWIKPSFLWMMYRCGWGTKKDQETVLAVEISREGFVWALRNACLSHHVPELHGDAAAWKQRLRQAPARVQWDPERDLWLRPLPYRSLQLGLAGEAAARYADEWITGIEDMTPLAAEIRALVRAGEPERAAGMLPQERPLPLDGEVLAHLRA
ncbi:DUF4291 domain-containing protein [Streptomyces sp. CHD11]|uniref:DUF4291 domain-containing protein n=1 Tax=Streptomyces sp. CHD11 TaxID=2741325 RepID=UPI001BFC3E8A|nr:DUF4291 domain-containing protein [Streptomyces sp. CHD11]MBT3153933.1 DUF4291 domain-containing protein [Streptomyces sp. CHD11]